jgi:FlaA1/EpsC-like NDP-sugar epimerase
MLWGASVFAQNLLNKEEEKNDKILGIVDKNEASWGKSIGHYKIYPPNSIKELKPDGIVVMVLSNHEKAYSIIKDEIEKNYSDVELLPDIFNE